MIVRVGRERMNRQNTEDLWGKKVQIVGGKTSARRNIRDIVVWASDAMAEMHSLGYPVL